MFQALLLAILGYLQVLVQSQPMQEGFVEVPGARIHYKDSGGHGVPRCINAGGAYRSASPAITSVGSLILSSAASVILFFGGCRAHQRRAIHHCAGCRALGVVGNAGPL